MGKHHTKDEQFMICLYENAKTADDMEAVFNRYEIGRQVSMHERGVEATCKLLVKANFIKKDSESEIYLTPHGVSLVEKLLEE